MTTILVDQDLCTRCGTCAVVCPSQIIEPADEKTLPSCLKEREPMCLQCGQCEAFCPTQALLLNIRPDDRVRLPPEAGSISFEEMGWYLKKRRSIRHYKTDPVPRDTILSVLDIARYAASGGNGQPVEWIVVHDPERVRQVAGLTVDWMRSIRNTAHPMGGYVPGLIAAWEAGSDVICRGAPHLVVPHIPRDNPIAVIDAIIALTHFDLAAPAFGVGTCWAGFVAGAAREYAPLREALAIPEGRVPAYAMMFGFPRYRIHGIPRRKPLRVEWL